MSVVAIYLQNNPLGRANLEHGIRTRRWGFTKDRPAYRQIEPRTLVLIGTGYAHPTAGASPRKPLEVWSRGSLDRIMVFRAESTVRLEHQPHWPDEIATGSIKYPHRFDVTPFRDLGSIDLAELPLELVEAFRLSALTQGGAVAVEDSTFTRAIEQGRTPEILTSPVAEWPSELEGFGALFVPADHEAVARLRADGPAVEEFVLWRPASDSGYIAPVGPGEPVILTSRFDGRPDYRTAIGGGVFSGRSRMTLSELWEWFGQASGARSIQELRATFKFMIGQEISSADDPEVDTLLLYHARFFRDEEVVELAVNETQFILHQGRYVQLGGLPPTDTFVRSVLTYFQPRSDPEADEVAQIVLGTIRAAARTVVPRLGQGAFRAMVSDAYAHQCALTGYRVRPVLEAAHIKSYSSGGEHRLDNGLLLRSDVHTLFDRGFISFAEGGRLLVSPQLRERFGNGDWYYERAGMELAKPRRAVDAPNEDYLAWHRQSVFFGV
jgi:putative restriction endonuclease